MSKHDAAALRQLNHKQSEEFRSKVRVAELRDRLHRCAMGEAEMTPTQVQAARILLDKVISEAPKDVNTNVSGEMTLVIETGVPRNGGK